MSAAPCRCLGGCQLRDKFRPFHEPLSFVLSRVGVVGPNGAGKSTLIKLLTVSVLFPVRFHALTSYLQGETVPQEGTVYKHPALRVGYVSQHATHHIGTYLIPFHINIFRVLTSWQRGIWRKRLLGTSNGVSKTVMIVSMIPNSGSSHVN